MNRKLRISLKIAGWVTGLYLALFAFLYIMQSSLIFLPGSDNPFLKEHKPFHSFTYQTPMGLTLQGLWFPPARNKPLIVLFHGNHHSIGYRLDKARKYLNYGYGVALVEYRGYGGNPGVPSEKNLLEDARAAIGALQRKGVPVRQMIFYGESLGTNVATRMALEMPQAIALVLEAPYTSIADVAAKQFFFMPVHGLVRDRFETFKLIGALKMPLLVLHGSRDLLVPFEMGRKIFALAGSKHKEFIEITGGSHNNLYDFKADMIVNGFLEKIR